MSKLEYTFWFLRVVFLGLGFGIAVQFVFNFAADTVLLLIWIPIIISAGYQIVNLARRK